MFDDAQLMLEVLWSSLPPSPPATTLALAEVTCFFCLILIIIVAIITYSEFAVSFLLFIHIYNAFNFIVPVRFGVWFDYRALLELNYVTMFHIVCRYHFFSSFIRETLICIVGEFRPGGFSSGSKERRHRQ